MFSSTNMAFAVTFFLALQRLKDYDIAASKHGKKEVIKLAYIPGKL